MKKRLFYAAMLTAVFVAMNMTDVILASAMGQGEEKTAYVFSGNGTRYDPYLISSYEDLAGLRDMVDSGNNVSGKYFRQTADIVFPDGTVWNPIGKLEPGYEFAGYYDGNGHTLANIDCEDQYAGVFSYLAGEVRNLGIESGFFDGDCAASITSHGTDTARIINCYNKADVYGNSRAGGITDNYPGLIMFCWNFGHVYGKNEGSVTAGITSYGDADIRYCYAADAEKLTDETTFGGKTADSCVIGKADTEAYIQQSYQDMFAVYSGTAAPEDQKTEGLMNRGNTVFMVCEDGDVFFSKDYEPDVFRAEKEEAKERYLGIWEKRYDFEGDGSAERPFIVSSYEDLALLRDCVDAGISYRGYYFEQADDIYFPEDEVWNPIGDLKKQLVFSGTYDGNGYCLYNVFCEDNCAGIFSYLDGEVRNLGIESGCFRGVCVGSITSHGTGRARIMNCYNKAEVTGTERAGGLVDNFPGKILFSWNLGKVSGEKKETVAAGICSYGMADIAYCYSTDICDIVDTRTFTGVIREAERIKDTDAAGRLRQNESAYGDYVRNEWMEPDDMVFCRIDESGELVFDRTYMPENLSLLTKLEYIPECFLLFMALLLGAGTAACYGYRGRHRAETAPEKAVTEKAAPEKNVTTKASQAVSVQKTSGKERRSRVIAAALTAVFFGVCFSYVTKTLNLKSDEGIWNLRHWEKAENENTDILFLGASTITSTVEIADLWNDYGIACYAIGSGGAAFYDDYYRLIEAEKSHHSSMVVLDVRAAEYQTEYAALESWKKMSVSGLGLSVNKWNYVNAAIEPEQRLDYFFAFPVYRGRYHNVSKWDFRDWGPMGEDDKGAWTVYYGNLYKPELICVDDIVAYRALYEKEEYYLRKIIEYCDRNQIELLLLRTPSGSRAYSQPFYNVVELIAEEYRVPFLDMNCFDEEIGLTELDFHESGAHLNVAGARKCTRFFGNYLIENYDFTDHRGDENYISWDRFAANREDLYLRAIYNTDDYFEELASAGKRVAVVSYRLSGEKSENYQEILKNLEEGGYEFYDEKDVLYGEEQKLLLTFDDHKISITKEYAACRIEMDEKKTILVDSPGIVLIVYDDVNGTIADIAAFTSAGNFAPKHLYAGGEG